MRFTGLFLAMLALGDGGSVSPVRAASTSPSVVTRIPSADFAESPFLSDPLLSPDGGRVAMRMMTGDKVYLAIFAVGKWEKPIRTISTGDKTRLRGFRWATDDRLVFSTIKVGYIYGIPVALTALATHTLSTSETKPLSQGGGLIRDKVVYFDPAGNYVLLLSQKGWSDPPGVDRVDIATGTSVQVQEPRKGVTNWFADQSGVVRAGVDYGEKVTRIHYRAASTQPWTTIKTSNNFNEESVIEAIRFAGAIDKGVIITNGPTGRFAAYHYDFGAQKLGAPIFQHAVADVDEIIMGDHSQQVDGVSYEDDRPRIHWLKPAIAAIQARIDRALPDRTNRIVNWNRDQRLILFTSSSASDPGAFYLFDRQRGEMTQFAAPFEKVDPRKLRPVTSHRFKARDGLSILAYLTLPELRPGVRPPVIVLPHGGPFARDKWEYDPYVQFLANRGYAVLQPQFRGSTGFGRDFVERGYGQWGSAMQDDLDDAVDWAVRQGFIDGQRACIMGISYGGYAAMWGAIRNPERYRCAISVAGVSDIGSMLKYDSKFLLASRYAPVWRQRVAGDQKRDLRHVSPFYHAARLRIPMMIVHGEQDTNVPVEQSRKMVQALTKAGKPVETLFYKESEHGLTESKDMVDFLPRLEAFLARHNPPAP